MNPSPVCMLSCIVHKKDKWDPNRQIRKKGERGKEPYMRTLPSLARPSKWKRVSGRNTFLPGFMLAYAYLHWSLVKKTWALNNEKFLMASGGQAPYQSISARGSWNLWACTWCVLSRSTEEWWIGTTLHCFAFLSLCRSLILLYLLFSFFSTSFLALSFFPASMITVWWICNPWIHIIMLSLWTAGRWSLPIISDQITSVCPYKSMYMLILFELLTLKKISLVAVFRNRRTAFLKNASNQLLCTCGGLS